MTIRYKRVPYGHFPPEIARLLLLTMCSRIELPSRIVFVDYTQTWALAR